MRLMVRDFIGGIAVPVVQVVEYLGELVDVDLDVTVLPDDFRREFVPLERHGSIIATLVRLDELEVVS